MSRDGFRMGQVDLAALRRGTGGRIGELGLDPLGRAPGFYQAPTEDTEAARVLAEADRERRERAAEQRALESLAGLTDEDGSPMVQPERGLGPQMSVRSVDDIALEEFAGSPGASAALNMGESTILPFSRLGTGAYNALFEDIPYDETQRELDRLIAQGREENPRASIAGMGAGILPSVIANPTIAASSPLLARLGPAGARIAAGTLEGIVSAQAQDVAARRPLAESSVPTAAMLGMGFGTAAEGVGQLVEAGRRMVPSLESFADVLRVRGSAGRTLPQMRAIDDLPGGIPAAARDLRELGISPRGSVHSMDTAAERAAGVNARASRDLGRVFDEMAVADEALAAAHPGNIRRGAALEAVDLDDPSMLYPTARGSAEDRIRRAILDNRIDRAASETRAQRMQHFDEQTARAATETIDEAAPISDTAATQVGAARGRPGEARPRVVSGRIAPTREQLERALDRGDFTDVSALPEMRGFEAQPRMGARSSESEEALRALVDDLLPESAGTVRLNDVLGVLDERARTYEGLPSGAGPLAAVRGMADDYRSTGGRLTFRQAQDEKELLDQAINYNPNTNPVTPRANAMQGDLRSARQALQREMDSATQRQNPELGALYPRARREHQLSGIVGRVSDDAALRDAANRQFGNTDYMSVPDNTPPISLSGAVHMVGNRLLRGREATIGAAGAERLSDALQAMPNIQNGGQRAARVGSLPAGQPAREPQRQPAAPRAPAGMSQTDFAALPVMDAGEIPEFSEDELGDLPELSEDEINALPVMEAP